MPLDVAWNQACRGDDPVFVDDEGMERGVAAGWVELDISTKDLIGFPVDGQVEFDQLFGPIVFSK